MRFGRLDKRVLFLEPGGVGANTIDETTLIWVPMHPLHPPDPIEPPPFWLPEHCRNIDMANLADALSAALAQYGVWASVAPMTGREYAEAQKIRGETTYRVRIRHIPRMRSDLRMVYRDKIFTIVSVLEQNCDRREMQLICKEEGTGGAEAG